MNNKTVGYIFYILSFIMSLLASAITSTWIFSVLVPEIVIPFWVMLILWVATVGLTIAFWIIGRIKGDFDWDDHKLEVGSISIFLMIAIIVGSGILLMRGCNLL